MQLLLIRYKSDKYGTHGELFLDNKGKYNIFLCYTLEPSYQSYDLFGSREVEEGTYNISVTYSPKFKINLPLLDVPSRSGIRIHSGNTAQDTSGCILVGFMFDDKGVSSSRFALTHVLNVINHFKLNQITISSIYGKVPCF